MESQATNVQPAAVMGAESPVKVIEADNVDSSMNRCVRFPLRQLTDAVYARKCFDESALRRGVSRKTGRAFVFLIKSDHDGIIPGSSNCPGLRRLIARRVACLRA